MRVAVVSYGRTKSKNYQSEKAEVSVELGDGDTFEAGLARCKALVSYALGEGPSEEEVQEAQELLQKANALKQATR